MSVGQERTATSRRSFTVVDGHEAEMVYSRRSERLIILNHTGVPAAAQVLAERVVAPARTGRWTIMPLFKAFNVRHCNAWQDVIK